MSMDNALTVRRVVAHDRPTLDEGITKAVQEMMTATGQLNPSGLLISRLEDTVVQIELTDSVPFGYIEQRDFRP